MACPGHGVCAQAPSLQHAGAASGRRAVIGGLAQRGVERDVWFSAGIETATAAPQLQSTAALGRAPWCVLPGEWLVTSRGAERKDRGRWGPLSCMVAGEDEIRQRAARLGGCSSPVSGESHPLLRGARLASRLPPLGLLLQLSPLSHPTPEGPGRLAFESRLTRQRATALSGCHTLSDTEKGGVPILCPSNP